MNRFLHDQIVKFIMAALSVFVGAYGLSLNNFKGYFILSLCALLFYLYVSDMYKELKKQENDKK